jgi:hypothetical protein
MRRTSKAIHIDSTPGNQNADDADDRRDEKFLCHSAKIRAIRVLSNCLVCFFVSLVIFVVQ